MTPYYTNGLVTIFMGDCREILPAIDPGSIDLVLTDPPYGINHPTNYKKRGRGGLAQCKDYPPVFGDDSPFNPAQILALQKPTLLFGANYYAGALPASSGWVVWDKMRPEKLDQATAELAWSNFVKGVRVFRYLWNGMMRSGNEALVHPTQKPVALWEWILDGRWTPAGALLDPYMGGGGTLVAACNRGRRAIGIEIEERYCEIAARRLDGIQPSMPQS